jgi:hypothetical protein
MTNDEVIALMRERGFNAYERIVPQPLGHHVPLDRFAPYTVPASPGGGSFRRQPWTGEVVAHDTVRDSRPMYDGDDTRYAWRFCSINDPAWRQRWGI